MLPTKISFDVINFCPPVLDMSSQSWYDVLGVSNDATAEDIQKAYRAKAREFHPDRAGNDGSQFKRMKEGVDVLLDPEQRKNYDKKLASGETTDDNEDSSQAVRIAVILHSSLLFWVLSST